MFPTHKANDEYVHAHTHNRQDTLSDMHMVLCRTGWCTDELG